MRTPDEDLMTAVGRGDEDAFGQIVQRYEGPVWRVAARYSGDAAEAKDIAQCVFMKLFESARRYEKTAKFRTYLFRIVNTTCIDHVRKKRPAAVGDPPEVLDGSPSPSDAMVIRERNRTLRTAINGLPLRQRSAIVLRYDAELPVRDVAEILKLSEKAAERLLARARTSLQTKLIESGVLAGDS
jgi:RNA polymerase sigma-70 factor, ECF subfamily